VRSWSRHLTNPIRDGHRTAAIERSPDRTIDSLGDTTATGSTPLQALKVGENVTPGQSGL